MQGAINSGVHEGMILEYQTYINSSELRNYEFILFGIRHGNQLYSVGQLPEEKQQVFKMLSDYLTGERAQEEAKQYGFETEGTYTPEIPESSGDMLLNAQKVWKEKKDGDQEIVAVFIVDVSGSVDGDPIIQMKESLINAGKYIKPESYIGLISYSTKVTINLTIAKFDLNQKAYFNGEVENLTAGGNTATFEAIAVGIQMLEAQREEYPNAKFMLLTLIDGMSNGSLNSVRGYIEKLKVPVYTIGYNVDINVLRQISSINEAASINVETEDIVYKLKMLFNAEM